MSKILILIVRESLLSSAVADIFSICLSVGTVFVNHQWLGGFWIIDIFLLLGVLALLSKRGSKKVKRMSEVQAYHYLRQAIASKGVLNDSDLETKEMPEED